MIKNIYLQRFAEETIPEKEEVKPDTKVDSKPEDSKAFASTIRSIFGLKDKEPEKKEPAKETDKKSDDAKKPDEKPDEKPETSKEPETKEPEKKEPEKAVEEEYDTLVVLGKEKKVPVSERKMWMQKGLDYDFVKGEKVKAEATLKRIAQAEGYKTVDEYLAELGNREKTKLAEQIEEAEGDPDKISDIVQNHPIVQQTKEERRKLDYINAKADLSKDEFFKKLEPELDRLMEQNQAADPNLVYSVIVGNYVRSPEYKQELAAEKEKAAKEKQTVKESAEKKVIADMHDKERRSAPTGGDTNEKVEETAQMTSAVTEIANAFGVPASKVAQRIAKNKNRRS
jgi:hypothetical protein